MSTHARFFLLAVFTLSLAGAFAAGQASPPPASLPPKAPGTPFNPNDPQIAKLRQLDWKSADFNALDARGKATALLALNHGLRTLASQLSAQSDLLVDYLDQKNLGGAYAAAESKIAAPPRVTFEDMQRLAAAYINTPEGQAQFGSDFTDTPDAMLQRYINLYGNGARREFESASEGRWHAQSMGTFLKEQGKLDDFRAWVPGEQQRRQAEYEKQLAANKAQQQEQRAAAADEKQRQQQQAAEQMAVVLGDMQPQQQPQQDQQAQPASGVNNAGDSQQVFPGEYGWNPMGYYPNGYYYNNAYRASVNDKVSDAYQRWGGQGGRPGGAGGVGGAGRPGGVGGAGGAGGARPEPRR